EQAGCEVGLGQQEAYAGRGFEETCGPHTRPGERGAAMKIRAVSVNNRRKAFEVRTAKGVLRYPFAKVDPRPTGDDPIARVWIDEELDREGFTYALGSGREGTVHIEQVLEYNKDPDYVRDRLLYRLTLEAQKRVAASSLPKRELIRRLGTSATQFYRL